MRMDTYQESATDVYGYTMWTVKFFPIFMFGHADVRCAVMMWRGHDQSSCPAYMHMDTLVICVQWIYHICVLAACLRCVEYRDDARVGYKYACIVRA